MGSRLTLIPDRIGGSRWCACVALQRYGPKGVSVSCDDADPPEVLDGLSKRLVCNWATWEHPDPNRDWALISSERWTHEWAQNGFLGRFASVTENIATARERLPNFHGLIVPHLGMWSAAWDINKRVVVMPPAVDCELFEEQAAPFKGRDVRVGWCGTRHTLEKFSSHGYDDVLVPLMKSISGNPNIEMVVNCPTAETRLTTSEMVKWYNGIDVLLVTAFSSGGPAVALEAMSCGRPVVGTNVGILGNLNAMATERFGAPAASLVSAYSDVCGAAEAIGALKRELFELVRDRQRAAEMGRSAKRIVQAEYNWSRVAHVWVDRLSNAHPRSVARTASSTIP